MKKTYIFFTTVLIVIGLNINAQNDTINQFNGKGQKHGYWKLFFSEKLAPTDSIHAAYFGYEVYDNGQKVMPYRKVRSLAKATLIFSGQAPEVGKPIIIDGTFKYYIRDALVMEECFRQGYVSYSKSYKKNRKTGKFYVSDFYNFDKRYNNQAGSCYIELAFTPTSIVAYWHRKGEKRWKQYKTERLN